MAETWHERAEREAGEIINALLSRPMPQEAWQIGADDFFDPWEPFQLYGSYNSEFDDMAIATLIDIRDGTFIREDLAAEMFREMLCNLNFCDYGTSPRVCFAVGVFKERLPEYIEKWQVFRALLWKGDRHG